MITITKTDENHYRIESGRDDVALEWRRHVPFNDSNYGSQEAAWCEMTIYPDGLIGSYGGQVWPMAWPNLFTPVRNHVGHCGSNVAGIKLTDKGMKAFDLKHELDAGERVEFTKDFNRSWSDAKKGDLGVVKKYDKSEWAGIEDQVMVLVDGHSVMYTVRRSYLKRQYLSGE